MIIAAVPKTQTIRLVDSDEKSILEGDIVSLDILMSSAQEGLDMQVKDDQSRFLILFSNMLSKEYKAEVSPTAAYVLSIQLSKVSEVLKKSIEDLQSLSEPTEVLSEN